MESVFVLSPAVEREAGDSELCPMVTQKECVNLRSNEHFFYAFLTTTKSSLFQGRACVLILKLFGKKLHLKSIDGQCELAIIVNKPRHDELSSKNVPFPEPRNNIKIQSPHPVRIGLNIFELKSVCFTALCLHSLLL